MRGYLVVIGILVTLPIVYAEDAEPLHVAYCKHMGYQIQISNDNKPLCFDATFKCDATEFYRGQCVAPKVKELPKRKEGESVYVEFEQCEDGLVPSKPSYALEQPKCERPSTILNLWNSLMNLFS